MAPRDRSTPLWARPGRARLTDTLILMFYAGLAIGLAVLSSEPPHITPLWSMVVLGISGLMTLMIRRRNPGRDFAAAMVLSVFSLGVGSGAESLLAVMAVYTAGVHRTGRVAWTYFGVAMVCGAICAAALSVRGIILPPILGLAPRVLARDPLLDWANAYLIIAAALLIAALLGTNAGHRRRHIGELLDRADRLVRERDQQGEIARALERERIAREMHDVIAHSLSVIIAVSDGAYAVADERPAEAKAAIGRVAETGRRTLVEVRRLLGGVRGDDQGSAQEHAPQPTAVHLTSLVTEFASTGLPVRLTVAGVPSTDPGLGLTVYRIVQESLTNVLRHAQQVGDVMVTVTWMTETVTIVVRDTGPPASPPMHTGHAGRGILGMRERAALYAGAVEAGPQEDGGWRVFVRLRCEDPQL